MNPFAEGFFWTLGGATCVVVIGVIVLLIIYLITNVER
jgi:hypothetical protein